MANNKPIPVWAALSLWGSFLFCAFLAAQSLSEAIRQFGATELLLSCFIVAGVSWRLLSGKKKQQGGAKKKRTKKRRAALPRAGQGWQRSEEIFKNQN